MRLLNLFQSTLILVFVRRVHSAPVICVWLDISPDGGLGELPDPAQPAVRPAQVQQFAPQQPAQVQQFAPHQVAQPQQLSPQQSVKIQPFVHHQDVAPVTAPTQAAVNVNRLINFLR